MRLPRFLQPHAFHHQKSILITEFAFFSYGILFLLMSGGFLLVHDIKPEVLSYATNISVSDVIADTNVERGKVGATPVRYNVLLSKAAEAKAHDMFAKNYWAHFGPNGEKPWDFIQHEGYVYVAAGENLARDFNDSQGVVDAWMHSPSHKENLLNKTYQDIGVAVVNGTLLGHETTLVVQMFGKPYQPVSQIPQTVQAVEVATTLTNTTPKPSVNPVVSPVKQTAAPASPESTPTEQPVAAVQQDNQPKPEPLTRIAGSSIIQPLSLSKNVLYGIMIFVLLCLFIDSVVIRRRGVFRIATHSFAHIAMIAVILSAIVVVSTGKIL